MPTQQQPAAPIPAPVTFEIFTQRPDAANVATAFAAPAQTKPTAPKTMPKPKVVAEGSIRPGKRKANKGPAVATIIRKHRSGRGKTELAKTVAASLYKNLGEWAGTDSNSGLSIPIRIGNMFIESKPIEDDGEPFWRGPIVAVNSVDGENEAEEDVQIVIDTHVCHGDGSFVVKSLDDLVDNFDLQFVPNLSLNDTYQIVDAQGKLVHEKDSLCQEKFPAERFKQEATP
ncbi:hypothetical protein CYMTET_7017 [Cymbomonas tetramitiformis]|uniref:Uncharacterized protein n=1 Tax=Cymbomonas tetramitiformis TaxID=36881 RepID=A0AAE0GW14_9CHLO|nr:hypothetical protein CYMTET_7017 [Cymbomonas tetramitiformis]